ncbi:hypothetical protein J2W48_000644 [Flavobacterium piscis]|uniref:Uncharacterized protein n=1 Tax=Flavobacterium piscis TaxID=1114874 RepID=A0ABU1Y3B2_9FLAO|nr:hypothetical protein [Flavobacterium piscis]
MQKRNYYIEIEDFLSDEVGINPDWVYVWL